MAKINWIIAVHNSEADNTFLYSKLGTVEDIKKVMQDRVKIEKERNKSCWECNTGFTEYKNGSLYICAMFTNYHIDIDAYPVNVIPVI